MFVGTSKLWLQVTSSLKNSLASNLPLQLASGYHFARLIRGRWQRESWGSTRPLVPSTTHVSKTASPWPGEHNKNVMSTDTHSLTDSTQINIYTTKLLQSLTANTKKAQKVHLDANWESTLNVLPASNVLAKPLWQSMLLRLSQSIPH